MLKDTFWNLPGSEKSVKAELPPGRPLRMAGCIS
jgi:hypothetical protein